MSGYLEYNRGNEDFLEDGFFLQKPFSRDALVHKVQRRLLGGRFLPSKALLARCAGAQGG